MPRHGIIYEDVAHAAQQLASQGKIPTIEMIRLITGTGSHTTIAQHLKEWKHRQSQAKYLGSQNKVPEEIALTVKELWERLLSQADEKVAKIKQEFELTIATLKEQNAKLKEDNTRWQQQYHQIKQENRGLISDNTAFKQQIKELENERIALLAEEKSMKDRLQEKKHHLDEIRKLHQQAQANLEHFQEASREQRLIDQQRHDQAQTQLTQKVTQLKKELSQLNQHKNSLQQELEQAQYAKDLHQDQHSLLAAQHETIKSQLDQVNKEIFQQTEAKQHWQSQCQKKQERLDEKNNTNIKLQLQLAVLTHKLSDVQAELKECTEQNKLLAQMGFKPGKCAIDWPIEAV